MTLDSPHDAFTCLRFLNLNRTLIRTWNDVDILGRFPALRYLRIQGCPLFEVNDYLLNLILSVGLGTDDYFYFRRTPKDKNTPNMNADSY